MNEETNSQEQESGSNTSEFSPRKSNENMGSIISSEKMETTNSEEEVETLDESVVVATSLEKKNEQPDAEEKPIKAASTLLNKPQETAENTTSGLSLEEKTSMTEEEKLNASFVPAEIVDDAKTILPSDEKTQLTEKEKLKENIVNLSLEFESPAESASTRIFSGDGILFSEEKLNENIALLADQIATNKNEQNLETLLVKLPEAGECVIPTHHLEKDFLLSGANTGKINPCSEASLEIFKGEKNRFSDELAAAFESLRINSSSDSEESLNCADTTELSLEKPKASNQPFNKSCKVQIVDPSTVVAAPIALKESLKQEDSEVFAEVETQEEECLFKKDNTEKCGDLSDIKCVLSLENQTSSILEKTDFEKYLNLKSEINGLVQNISKLTMELGQKEKKLFELRPNSAVSQSLNASAEFLQGEDTKKELFEADDKIKNLSVQNTKFANELQELRKEFDTIIQEVAVLKESNSKLENELVLTKEDNLQLNKNLDEYEIVVGQLHNKCKYIQSLYDKEKKENTKLNIAIQEIVPKYDKAKELITILQENCILYDKNVKELVSRNSQITKVLESVHLNLKEKNRDCKENFSRAVIKLGAKDAIKKGPLSQLDADK